VSRAGKKQQREDCHREFHPNTSFKFQWSGSVFDAIKTPTSLRAQCAHNLKG
jgi:hypothetical protein